MLIHEDNQAAISIAKSSYDHPKTKHISVKTHFIRDLIDKNEIVLKYCPTDKMLADVFTKGLNSDKFVNMRSLIGMISSTVFQSI